MLGRLLLPDWGSRGPGRLSTPSVAENDREPLDPTPSAFFLLFLSLIRREEL